MNFRITRMALSILAGCLGASCTHIPEQAAAWPAAQAALRAPEVIDLWPGIAPGSEGWTQEEINAEIGSGPGKAAIVRNVVHPTLTAYLPDPAKATGSAVIVAPGGGFMMLSIDSEGHHVARWLAERGVAAFVLKYRLTETPVDNNAFIAKLGAMLAGVRNAGPDVAQTILNQADIGAADAIQAIKIVRRRAADFGYAPDRVGLLGFSAGAFITTRLVASADPASRPNFAAPIYGGAFTSGEDLPKQLPPLFIAVAGDDDLLADATVSMVNRLRTAGHRPAFHLYASGGHGFGMSQNGKASDHWIEEFYWWMEENKLVKR
jgi:acetyl esterase/lipase